MKKMMILLLGVFFLISLVGAQNYASGEILVGFDEEVTLSQANDLILSFELTWDDSSFEFINYGKVYVPEGEEEEWIKTFEEEEIVDYAELNEFVNAGGNGPMYGSEDSEKGVEIGNHYAGIEVEEELEIEKEGAKYRFKHKYRNEFGEESDFEYEEFMPGEKNRFKLGKHELRTQLKLKFENLTGENKSKIMARLSNGRNAEIKIMPNVASQRALERLRLKLCNESNNCFIELKEVGKENKTNLAYELKRERKAKLFGFMKSKMNVSAQVDAETGELLKTKKPWWAFLASEPEEEI